MANDIAARGKPELNFYASLIVVSINISMNVFLIPKFGMIGAAIATSSAYSVNFLIKIGIYKSISQCNWFQIFMPNSYDLRLFKFLMQKIKD